MAISSGNKNGRQPAEENPSPPADGDAASPAVDPAEDDDLEELVEDDTNDNGAEVEAKSKVKFAAPAPAPKSSINPYPFGHFNTPKKNDAKNAPFFSGGAIPSFGGAASAVGKRAFDPKPFVEAADADDDDAQPPERNFLGISPATRPTPPAPAAGQADGNDEKNTKSGIPFSFGAKPGEKVDSKRAQFSFGKVASSSAAQSSPLAAQKPFSFGDAPPTASTPSTLKPLPFGASKPNPGPFGAAAPANTGVGVFGSSSSVAKGLSFGTKTSPKVAAFGKSASSQPTSGFGVLPTKPSAAIAGFGAAASKTSAFGKPAPLGGASTFSFTSSAAQPSGGGLFGDMKKKGNDNDKPGDLKKKKGSDNDKPALFGSKASFGSKETAPSKPTATAPTPFATSAAPSPFGSSAPISAFGKSATFGTAASAPSLFGSASEPALAPKPAQSGASGASALAASSPFGTVSPKSSVFGAMKTTGGKSPFGGTPMPEMDGEKKSPYPFGSSPQYADSSAAFGAQNSRGKLFNGDAPMFNILSSPGNAGKKVSTPLFGLGSAAAQKGKVKFSKRPSFQTSLSPSAPVFVPGAPLFIPKRKEEKPEAVATEAAVEKAAVEKAAGPESIPEKKMEDTTPKKEDDAMEVSKPATSAGEAMEGVVSKAPSREWSHVFEGVNLMIVTPAGPTRKASVLKKKSVYKLDIFKDERGLRIEVICTQSIDDTVSKTGDVFVSWELGAEKMKVNRIKNRTTHAAMTRLGNAAPNEVTEDNPAKIFVVFKNGDECAKFLGICSNPHLQIAQTQPAVQEVKKDTAAVATKKEENSDEKEASGIIPTPSPPISQETPSASPPLTTPVASKDEEEEEGKTQTEATSMAQKSSAAALAAKKKLLMQKMRLKSRGKSLPASATPSATASASDDAGIEKKKEPPTATTGKDATRAIVPPPLPAEEAPSWAAQGTKRTASTALDVEEPKKQKKMVEGTTTGNMDVKSDIEELKKKEKAARKEMQKQIDVLTAKVTEMEESRAKAEKLNKSLRVDLREMKETEKKNGAAMKEAMAAVKKLKRAIRPVMIEKGVSLAVSEKLKACNPKSKEEFFERMWTFTPATWIGFAEIGKLDPVECAMHGWYNCDKNQLRSSEGAEIHMDEESYLSKLGGEEVKRVRENITGMAHPVLSAWRGTKCPDEFAETLVDDEEEENCFIDDPQDDTMVRCKWCGRKSCKSTVKKKNKSLVHYKHCAYLKLK